MSGLAYFFKPKINATDSASSSTATTEKRPGRKSKATKPLEILVAIEKPIQQMEIDDNNIPEMKIINEEQPENPPTTTPKIKLKFNLRSKSVQDTSDDRIITNITVRQNLKKKDKINFFLIDK
jgi:hypothetical protein